MRTLSKIQIEKAKLQDSLGGAIDQVKAKALASFKNNNGCGDCRGRGWVVIWDTLDCIHGSYAQYDDCPSPTCTVETRECSGISPDNNRYDFIKQSVWKIEDSGYIVDVAIIQKLKVLIAELNKEYFNVQSFNVPNKGKLIEVVKKARTRNSAVIGTIGKIIWAGTNEFNTVKLCLIDKQGIKHWTTGKSVKVLSVDTSNDYEEKHDDQYPLLCKVTKVREKSLFVCSMKDKLGSWLPKSQILNLDQVNMQLKNGKAITAMLPVWLAKSKGYLK